MKSDRGALVATPTEKQLTILDQLKLIAEELHTTVAASAILQRPWYGVKKGWRLIQCLP